MSCGSTDATHNEMDRLIAIMLGRLRMDVDECISAYNKLIATVFDKKLHQSPDSISGRVRSQFDSKRLKDAIEEVISKCGVSPRDLFNDGVDRGCRV